MADDHFMLASVKIHGILQKATTLCSQKKHPRHFQL